MAKPLSLKVNGKTMTFESDPDMPLLWVLRDVLNLTGTKYGCGIAACGACTVLIDGMAVRSCVRPVGTVGEASVRTIEGLAVADGPRDAQARVGTALQEAWIAHQVPQCGYCQSGFLMAATALLMTHARPNDAQIDAALTNLCRCGTYPRIRRAVHDAAARLAGSRSA